MASGTTQRALSLYRRLLRAARHWQGPVEEADYIRQEARQQFRAGRQAAASSAEEAERRLEDGENRLAIALHYGIAYPRMWHLDQFEKVPYVQAPALETDAEAVAGSLRDKGTAAKLAAAARRRRERLAQGGAAGGEPGGGGGS